MKLSIVILALGVAMPAFAQQQGVPSPKGWALTVLGGGTAFTDFQRSTVNAITTTSDGALRRDFLQRVGATTAPAVGAAVSYWPARNWGLRMYGSYAPSRFETMIAESDALVMDVPQSSEEAERLAPLSVLSIEAHAIFRLPTIRNRLMPYGFVGGGLVRYATSSGTQRIPAEASADFADGSETQPAARLGLGTMLPLGNSGVGLTFELSDQIARTPLSSGGDRSIKVTNAVGFMVGLKWMF